LKHLDAGQSEKQAIFTAAELLWVRASDTQPWADWDYELFGEALYHRIEYFAPDREHATYTDGPKPTGGLQHIRHRLLKRWLPKSNGISILVLRKDLDIWRQAARWADLTLTIENRQIEPGTFGHVTLTRLPNGRFLWHEQ
jgi:hypothetical protein